jgi:hypothetical protein
VLACVSVVSPYAKLSPEELDERAAAVGESAAAMSRDLGFES